MDPAGNKKPVGGSGMGAGSASGSPFSASAAVSHSLDVTRRSRSGRSAEQHNKKGSGALDDVAQSQFEPGMYYLNQLPWCFLQTPIVQFSKLADFYVFLTSISISKINLYHRFKLWSRSARFSDDLQI